MPHFNTKTGHFNILHVNTNIAYTMSKEVTTCMLVQNFHDAGCTV